MKNKKLYAIKETLDQVCKAIVSVLGVHITIVDSAYTRISGTGMYVKSLGQVLDGIGVFEHALITKKSKIVDNPREHEICLSCSAKETCDEHALVCCPIVYNDEVIGVMGVAAFDEEQKQRLLSNKDSMLDFIENMALLIVNKLKAHDEALKVSILAGELSLLFDTMENAMFTIDLTGNILRYNRLADQMLDLSKHGDQTMLLNDIDGLRDVVTIEEIAANHGMINNREFNYFSHGVEKSGLFSVRPVMVSEAIQGFLFTMNPIDHILKVMDAVSGGVVPTSFDDILGKSQILSDVKQFAQAVSKGRSTVLIQGETGTGKELFARAIHNESNRREQAFIAINCAAIPESLIESELFGYDDGAFTGARKGGRMGKFELANKGTIFLDEIGDMPLNLQTKLLRVLQEGLVERVGSHKQIPINIKVIAATNKKLEEMVQEKAFREDLYYRLNVMPLHLPPLRSRREDIIILVDYFTKKYAKQLDKGPLSISESLLDVLYNYDWPGNVRELENTVEYMVNISTTTCLTLKDLPKRMKHQTMSSDITKTNDIKSLELLEREAILNAVEVCPNLDDAAKALGIGRATLFRKLKKYRVDETVSL